MIDQIQWLGHGSFVINSAPVGTLCDTAPLLYINPWRISRPTRPADIILISDAHYDHCSPGDVEKLRAAHTRIIASEQVAQHIPGCTVLRPWQSVCVERIGVKAMPASMTADHAESIGFVISLNFYDIYYAGTSPLHADAAHIRPDIAILPIDTVQDEFIQAARRIEAKWVIPSHWGSTNAPTRIDTQRVVRQLAGTTEVVLLPSR